MAYLWELGEGASHQPGRRREPHREAGKRRASRAGRSGSEPARSSCGGGSLEAAQHSRTGEQGRPGSGATAGEPAAGDRRSTAGRVAGRSPWLGSPPPRLSRVASASRSPRGDESREVRPWGRLGIFFYFSCSLRRGAAGEVDVSRSCSRGPWSSAIPAIHG